MKPLPLAVLPFLVLLPATLPARAQEAGRIGFFVEAQAVPQFGAKWQFLERWAARGGFYFQGAPSEPVDWDATYTSLGVLYHFPLDAALRTYVGPEFSFNKLEYGAYVGAVAGAEYRLHDRLGAFGEFGLSLSTEEDGLNMLSTGAGMIFYFRR